MSRPLERALGGVREPNGRQPLPVGTGRTNRSTLDMTTPSPRRPRRTEHELFAEYRASKSRSVRNELVGRYEHVAHRCAMRFTGRGEAADDLKQVALIGLLKSVERFDPAMGVAFESYATPTIVGEIKRHFRDKTWRVSVPRRLKELRTGVFAAIDELEQRLERSPTPDEVAELIGVDRETVLETLLANQVYRSSSLDASREASGDALESLLCDPESSSDRSDHRLEAIAAVRTLGERDRRIIYWRFFEECTQAEIGDRLGVGQVQVSRLLKAALSRLREQCGRVDPDLLAVALRDDDPLVVSGSDHG
jgi:RNA polymerase sigma-B factor